MKEEKNCKNIINMGELQNKSTDKDLKLAELKKPDRPALSVNVLNH